MKKAALALITSACALSGCATAPAPATPDLTSCAAYQPAFDVTDRFMTTFNAREVAAHEATYNFPHVRIASGNVTIIPNAGTGRDPFPALIAEGWDRSAWANRRVIQCEATKAHMLTTFIRYRKDGTELSRFDSLYIVEFKGGKWGITARSSFAP